jgi:hypothetical protein
MQVADYIVSLSITYSTATRNNGFVVHTTSHIGMAYPISLASSCIVAVPWMAKGGNHAIFSVISGLGVHVAVKTVPSNV